MYVRHDVIELLKKYIMSYMIYIIQYEILTPVRKKEERNIRNTNNTYIQRTN